MKDGKPVRWLSGDGKIVSTMPSSFDAQLEIYAGKSIDVVFRNNSLSLNSPNGNGYTSPSPLKEILTGLTIWFFKRKAPFICALASCPMNPISLLKFRR